MCLGVPNKPEIFKWCWCGVCFRNTALPLWQWCVVWQFRTLNHKAYIRACTNLRAAPSTFFIRIINGYPTGGYP